MTRNYSAVTGACLLTRREVFEEVGGFDEERLPVTFNDVDLCLKMRRAGYLDCLHAVRQAVSPRIGHAPPHASNRARPR